MTSKTPARSFSNSEWPATICTIIAGTIILVVTPVIAGIYGVLQMTLFAALAIYALSQAFIWGFGGILCFGQSAFLGLGVIRHASLGLTHN